MTFISSPSQLTFLANLPKPVRFTIIIPDHRQTERMGRFFARIVGSIWNSIPYSVKSLSKSKSRNKIKQILLETLELENDYIEVSQLLNYFSNLSQPWRAQ